jgi:DNA invertase Pin-like site-specific DNA recombinase
VTTTLDYARHGDIVVVSAIDCLGRSVAEVTRTIADLGERGITLRALREGIDTATPTGRCGRGNHGHPLAELELELGCERRAASRQARRVRASVLNRLKRLRHDEEGGHVAATDS